MKLIKPEPAKTVTIEMTVEELRMIRDVFGEMSCKDYMSNPILRKYTDTYKKLYDSVNDIAEHLGIPDPD